MMMTTCWILWIAPDAEGAEGGALESLQATKRKRKTGLTRGNLEDRVDMASAHGLGAASPGGGLCHRGSSATPFNINRSAAGSRPRAGRAGFPGISHGENLTDTEIDEVLELGKWACEELKRQDPLRARRAGDCRGRDHSQRSTGRALELTETGLADHFVKPIEDAKDPTRRILFSNSLHSFFTTYRRHWVLLRDREYEVAPTARGSDDDDA
jgi:hypothetical protein